MDDLKKGVGVALKLFNIALNAAPPAASTLRKAEVILNISKTNLASRHFSNWHREHSLISSISFSRFDYHQRMQE